MIVSSEVVLKYLALHKLTEDGAYPSEELIFISDEDLKKLLIKFFFKSFKVDERFQFLNPNDNSICSTIKSIFDQPQSLLDQSIELLKYFTSFSNHEGELIIAYFEDCVLGDEVIDAIGLFKIENKEKYFKISEINGHYEINSDQGISTNKPDKGVLIFNTDRDSGYQCLAIDNTKKPKEGQLWKEDILGLEKIKDEYFQTQSLINNVQEFAHNTFPETEASEKIAFVNESMDYIKSNDVYNHSDYQEKILQSPELIERFEHFQGEKVEEEPELNVQNFEISKPAIKNTKRFIRSVIKLDKNFHVYVHGNKDQITKGFDDDKKKHFYTLYFDEEK